MFWKKCGLWYLRENLTKCVIVITESNGTDEKTKVGSTWRRKLSNIALVFGSMAVGLGLSVSEKGLWNTRIFKFVRD